MENGTQLLLTEWPRLRIVGRLDLPILPRDGPARPSNLDVEKVASSAPAQPQLKITFTNRTIETCDVTGYPTVTLSGPSPRGTGWTTWTLVDQTGPGVRTAAVKLRFEQSAFATLTYLPTDSGGSPTWTPRFLSIALPGTAPPGEATPWSWQAIILQESATHPGTHIGPIQAQ
jgi:hypothetical protein